MSKYLPTFLAGVKWAIANKTTVWHVFHALISAMLVLIFLYHALHGGTVTSDQLDKLLQLGQP